MSRREDKFNEVFDEKLIEKEGEFGEGRGPRPR